MNYKRERLKIYITERSNSEKVEREKTFSTGPHMTVLQTNKHSFDFKITMATLLATDSTSSNKLTGSPLNSG